MSNRDRSPDSSAWTFKAWHSWEVPAPLVLVIDNYDSFTFNLVQYLGELGARTRVVKNDELDADGVKNADADGLLISPGPCTPNEAGVSLSSIEKMKTEIPILGVCLGHQSIGQAFGGKVVRAGRLMHGKTSPILHDQSGIFSGLPSPFTATRYHSLLVEKESLPSDLVVTAWTAEGEIMGLRHHLFNIQGVQFHPESILTALGKDLLRNWLADVTASQTKRAAH
jgi:anthranilate synthase/aminodeoxychorismate synthase-like glutamine amidotransferase